MFRHPRSAEAVPSFFDVPWSRRTFLGSLALGALGLHSCGGGGAPVVTLSPSGKPMRATPITNGLAYPWGLAFLPDGTMLVTERPGTMRLVSPDGQTVSAPISGIPEVHAQAQGGLFDVQLDPDYPASPWIYWCYAEPGTGSEAGLNGTAVARGQLANGAMQNVQVIFRQTPKVTGDGQYGGRIAFARDKTLFITLGDRQKDDPAQPTTQYAQNLTSLLGKIVHVNRDGSVPSNNPDFGVPGADPRIWSYGHRNPQGAALHPATGDLWISEHGPQGGDEINLILPGRNYGWPIRSYGCPYGSPVGDACRVGGGIHAPQFEEPLTYWVPTSIAPAGMAFCTSARYAGWQGNLFVGALAGQALWRLTLDGNKVVAREALFQNMLGRIRHVRQAPDGLLYLLTDSAQGQILRIDT